MHIIRKLEEYYITELAYLKAGLDKEVDHLLRNDIAWFCVQRCLGAAQFAKSCGGDYGIIEAMFEDIKTKIAEMENGG